MTVSVLGVADSLRDPKIRDVITHLMIRSR